MRLDKYDMKILQNILCDIIYRKVDANAETWRLALDINSYISQIPYEDGIIIEDAEYWTL